MAKHVGQWPLNRNHEAARRHVNQMLRDRGRPDYSRRETQIAELLDDLTAELHELRARVYGTPRAGQPLPPPTREELFTTG